MAWQDVAIIAIVALVTLAGIWLGGELGSRK